MLAVLALLAAIGASVALADEQPNANLRIVVVAGEDAVNIIQQKTAVAPVVEVRDRNNLPIAGASVTFTISGSSSAFTSGLQTVTVVSDAAGRAAATLNPLGTGSFRIGVSAAHQGQSATITINQTNFATAQAAEAARAAGQSSQAANTRVQGGASSRVPAKLIAGIAGGVAAAGLLATQANGGNTAPTIASVEASPRSAVLGTDTSIAFTVRAADRDNDQLIYRWDFGDGNTATVASPSHVYRAAGDFIAKVTISDGTAETTGQVNVAIRTLTGTWRSASSIETGSIGAITLVFNFVQSGLTVTGTTPFFTGSRGTQDACDYTGVVRGTVPRISLTSGRCGGFFGGRTVSFDPSTLVVDPGPTADTIVGTWATLYPVTLIRQ